MYPLISQVSDQVCNQVLDQHYSHALDPPGIQQNHLLRIQAVSHRIRQLKGHCRFLHLVLHWRRLGSQHVDHHLSRLLNQAAGLL